MIIGFNALFDYLFALFDPVLMVPVRSHPVLPAWFFFITNEHMPSPGFIML